MHIACEYVISKLLALKTLETQLIANVLGLPIPMKLNEPIVRVFSPNIPAREMQWIHK